MAVREGSRRRGARPPPAPPADAAPGVWRPSPGFQVQRVELDPTLDLQCWVAPELGNASYLLHVPSSPTVALIDPVRDIGGYLQVLEPGKRPHLWALETHVHNDFVSGARELEASRGATIVASGDAPLQYAHRSVRDGERLAVGSWSLEVLATPGHTPEHVSYLLHDPKGQPRALFSGGALMVGGAARTDLLGVAQARPLARRLYTTLHEKLRDLPGEVLLLPTHGGGSFCAAGGGEERVSTLRAERSTNPLLRARNEEEFLARILEQGPFPRYFLRMREVNSRGAPVRGAEEPVPPPLSIERFDRLRTEGAVVLDTRDPAQFDRGHVPGSYAIPQEGPLSAWVGWLLSPDQGILLLSENEEEAGLATRQLFRIGYDGVRGFLAGGIRVWESAGHPLARVTTLDARDLGSRLASERPGVVLDVREAHEWFRGHIPGSLNIPVASLPLRIGELPRGVPLLVHCAAGYRSTIASSLLEQAGLGPNVVRVRDGYDGWAQRRSR